MNSLECAIEAIRGCRRLREGGGNEAALRSELQSHLRRIFPSDEDRSWLDRYSSGTEASVSIATQGVPSVTRFIDNLVGSTTIEYESDLRVQSKLDEGYEQVREHIAGLINSGVPVDQARGILSDTVYWYVYDASLVEICSAGDCSAENVQLSLIDELRLEGDDPSYAGRFIQFLRKHLAREKSRPLSAEFLVSDIGLESALHDRVAHLLINIVSEARGEDPSVALATDLWSKFVDRLEGAEGSFRVNEYVDELYLVVLSRLFAANALLGEAKLGDDEEVKSILNGRYFKESHKLDNMVEADYFGWITRPEHVNGLVPLAQSIQQDMYAYDYSYFPEEDLFGRLMAELARKGQRKLLGQELTPSWLAKHLARRCIDNLPEGQAPRILDVCCGSGTILTEVIKASRDKFGFSSMEQLHTVVSGFDIDPLAVSLSKTAWVMSLASEIGASSSLITIPIYHADSLFSATPVSHEIPLMGEAESIEILLDGEAIAVPEQLFQPDYGKFFNLIVDWAYDEALEARSRGGASQITADVVGQFLDQAVANLGLNIQGEFLHSINASILALVSRLSDLAISNRNGIWAFILRNTYRPGLLGGQFNGLVSNPPWLAMSVLADNPYKIGLSARASLYDICPPSASFLHLELATVHLLHAVDRYLCHGAAIACLVPGTILNGHHHQAFRDMKFLSSSRPVDFVVSEVWQVALGIFKHPGAALIGSKRPQAADFSPSSIRGFVADLDGLAAVDFSEVSLAGSRTAWMLARENMPAVGGGISELPQQGADIMPRSCVCIDVMDEDGSECQVKTPDAGSRWFFSIKESKKYKGKKFPGRVSPRFIYQLAQSLNLLPFVLGEHCVPVALPAEKDASGDWRIHDDAEIRRMGLIESARRFQSVNAALSSNGKGASLQERINERGKLVKQNFKGAGYLVLSGAGGKHISAACIGVGERDGLVIDQTLYWSVLNTREEASYRVGVLNSRALTEAISPYNPRGSFGERHIHTLPYRLMPDFDPSNDDHVAIARLADTVASAVGQFVRENDDVDDPRRSLSRRRGKVRDQLMEMEAYMELEQLCASILGTVPD